MKKIVKSIQFKRGRCKNCPPLTNIFNSNMQKLNISKK